jgi:hypothetical protein
MNVHDQLIYARHEEPPRAGARTRREAQAQQARRAASPSDVRTDSVPGWHARALRFSTWRLRRPAAAGPAIDRLQKNLTNLRLADMPVIAAQ